MQVLITALFSALKPQGQLPSAAAQMWIRRDPELMAWGGGTAGKAPRLAQGREGKQELQSLLSTFPTLGSPRGPGAVVLCSVPPELNSFVGGSRLQTQLLWLWQEPAEFSPRQLKKEVFSSENTSTSRTKA